MFKKWKSFTRKEKSKEIIKFIFVIVGTLVIAFGGTAFLLPTNINAGGLSGIGIVAKNLFIGSEEGKLFCYNITIAVASIILWVLGLIFLGKDFALKTLLSTIVYPLGNALFTLVPGIKDFTNSIYDLFVSGGAATTGDLILLGAFGGTFVGVGVSITFLAGGSSGGVDVLSFIIEKFLHIKQSIGTFFIDGSIIGTGIIISLVNRNQELLKASMGGIVTAILTALIIEIMYISTQKSYQADIISSKWEEISKYAQDNLGRGATIYHAQGGYKGEERVMLRVVFDATQYNQLRNYISKVDPHAFVTFTRTNATYGEGFKAHKRK